MKNVNIMNIVYVILFTVHGMIQLTRKHSQYFFKQLDFEQLQPATCELVGVTLLVKAVAVRCIVAKIATFLTW